MAEWGMHGLQASFPHLTDWFVYQGGRTLQANGYNKNVSAIVEINQIHYVFMPFMKRYKNAEYDMGNNSYWLFVVSSC